MAPQKGPKGLTGQISGSEILNKSELSSENHPIPALEPDLVSPEASNFTIFRSFAPEMTDLRAVDVEFGSFYDPINPVLGPEIHPIPALEPDLVSPEASNLSIFRIFDPEMTDLRAVDVKFGSETTQ